MRAWDCGAASARALSWGVALLVGATACGSKTALSGQSPAGSGSAATSSGNPPDATSFPIGIYTNCAQGFYNASGNLFRNAAGFGTSGTLTLLQSGLNVNATYVDQNGVTQSVNFTRATGTSASITQAGQEIPGVSGLCVMGPRNEGSYPASMTTEAGALLYGAGMVFITLTGSVEADAGACGIISEPDESFWLICEDHAGDALPAIDERSPVAVLPAGQYSCSSQIESSARVDGIQYFVSDGGSGTLTLTQDAAKLSAQYEGDSSLAGTLSLGVTSATTAIAEPGQLLMAPCMVPLPSDTALPEPLAIAAGVLTIADSTLFLSLAATAAPSSACPGAQVAGSIVCSM